jgi:hypothetical protein
MWCRETALAADRKFAGMLRFRSFSPSLPIPASFML